MMVLCSNHSSKAFHAFAQEHPGKCGWLMGPSSWKTPRPHLPYALDNDAFPAWRDKKPWNETAWLAMLAKVYQSPIKPMWALVPDVVADKKGTLEKWKHFAHFIVEWPKAFAVQDAMTPGDVPKDADVIFVGGTTEWKWRSLPIWCEHFPRVHVGRVTTGPRLEIAERNGAESCDGTGFFRGSWHSKQARQLRNFIEGWRDNHPELWKRKEMPQ